MKKALRLCHPAKSSTPAHGGQWQERQDARPKRGGWPSCECRSADPSYTNSPPLSLRRVSVRAPGPSERARRVRGFDDMSCSMSAPTSTCRADAVCTSCLVERQRRRATVSTWKKLYPHLSCATLLGACREGFIACLQTETAVALGTCCQGATHARTSLSVCPCLGATVACLSIEYRACVSTKCGSKTLSGAPRPAVG
ncbi:hypothetical protein L226DRAFT_201887 [Lentinus tigrinus ALCF2SS1-7]|uniref:Uncharacterized protein n=1 Tax=Lentinus tigrinus ALCF2SS1-6 TaxID=1328759 RepID=A0A5C2STC1_9APHY|nr:hypothetical protein L227DRAFT_147959 [Lentinus tigrinus ALCF2SS1-6]RPD80475.1 hypothetical protein L226DRAFT_201887 [Lentinus tigrinus ALCF2SS1-7]